MAVRIKHFFQKRNWNKFYYGAGCTSYEKENVLGASFSTIQNSNSGIICWQLHVVCSKSERAALFVFWEPELQTHVFYDGKIVVKNVRAGGYILGQTFPDEGSGAVTLGQNVLV